MTALVATRRLVPVAMWMALVALWTPAAHGASNEWAALLKQFTSEWKIGGLKEKKDRPRLRAAKRDAVKILRDSEDGRAVPVLLAAHAKQMKFVEKLRKQWVARDKKWKKQQPSMEAALQAAPKNAKGQPLVTKAINEYFTEKGRIERLYREVTHEEEIAADARLAMTVVINEIKDKEREIALGKLISAAGRGQTASELDFVRALGHVEGDRVTETLTKLAGEVQPLVVAAALEALGRQNTVGAIDILQARLEDPRWQLRVAAIEGLSFYRSARVVELLFTRAEKEDGVIQRYYLTALAKMFGHSAGATVVAFRRYWEKSQADVIKRWEESPAEGPVRSEPAPVMVKGKEHGTTTFYGVKTESKHIIFVIDTSGSMGPEHGGVNADGKSRMEVVKKQLNAAIRTLTDKESDERGVASFNVVAYEATVQVFKPGKMVPASKKNKEAAFAWIDALPAFGATNIYDAIEQAFQIIGTRKAKKQYAKGADTIFVMTDGKPNRGKVVDPELIRQEVAKMNRDRKITIHTIGVGEGHDADFLRGLAVENNGEYHAR